MPYDPNKHNRRSLRLHGYDYTQAGAYFVTICVQNRHGAFGKVIDGIMRPSPIGEVAHRVWQEIPDHFTHVTLDAFVVMPNHVHGIVFIVDDDAIRHYIHENPLRWHIDRNHPDQRG